MISMISSGVRPGRKARRSGVAPANYLSIIGRGLVNISSFSDTPIPRPDHVTKTMSNKNPNFVPQRSYAKQELVECGYGHLFGPGNAKLPVGNMLMVDRIVEITDDGGEHGKGHIVAELDIHPDMWFFACHFPGDPVMPGCLGLDAMWQLVGFFLGWRGNLGKGRALGSGEVKFTGEILPGASRVVYDISMSRVIERKLVMGIADGTVAVDGKVIYTAKGLKVGLFTPDQSFQQQG